MKWSDLLLPSPKYATHNLDKKWEGTMSPGILYPIYHRLMIPGDTFKFGIRHLIRTNPTKAPLFSSFKVNVVTVVSNVKNYAIALEGYRRNFDWRSVSLPHFTHYLEDYTLGRPSTDLYPANVLPRMGVKETSLMDYLGYPRGWIPTPYSYVGSVQKNAIPFLVYYDFFRNYMLNPQSPYFPIFRPNNATSDTIGRSYVTSASVSDLDTFFEKVHTYYDGSNGQGINEFALSEFTSLFGTYSYWAESYRKDSNLKHTASVYHGGLVSTLYDPDMNTQWMSQANFDKMNEARISTQTTNSVSGDLSFTNFGDIVKASSIWQFMMGEVYGDGTYANHIYSQYGVSVRSDMNIPQIVHVMNSVIGFEDITSQSDTQQNANTENEIGSPVGQQYGVGRGYGQTNKFTVRNSDKNLAMVMVFAWITPKVRYATGIHPDTNITRLSDVYVPAFDNYALQPLFREQLYAIPVADGDYMLPNNNGVYDKTLSTTPHIWNSVIGYQPAFTEYKSDVDTVHGLLRSQLSYWTIVKSYAFNNMGIDTSGPSLLEVNDGYVHAAYDGLYIPEEDSRTYNVPFSVENEDNFQAQFKFDITAIRPISKSVLPNVR